MGIEQIYILIYIVVFTVKSSTACICTLLCCFSSEYIKQLMEEVMEACIDGEISDEPEPVNVPPVLAAQYEHPDKAEAVTNFVSRFAHAK